MPKKKTIALSICGLFSIVGCASTSEQADWRVEPFYGVTQTNKTPEQLYRLGQYYSELARYDEAITAYKAALGRDPGFAKAHNGLGVVYARQGRYDKAILAFQDAIAIAPRSAYLHNNLGYTYFLQGSNERATKALEEARHLDSQNKTVLRNLTLARKNREQVITKSIERPVAANLSKGPVEHSTQALAEKLPGAQPDVALVAVAPNVYELREKKLQGTEVKTIALPATPAKSLDPRNPAGQTEPFRLEVSNGNGTKGMARRVAKSLKYIGLETALLTDQPPFQQVSTEIQYRDGYRPQAARLGAALQVPIDLVKNDTLRNDIDVRLLLGRDIASEAALFQGSGPKTSIAELQHIRLEVSNGNGVEGMAARVAKQLNHAGVNAVLLTNQPSFDQATTEIQYREGYRSAATELGTTLKVQTVVVKKDDLQGDIQVRLVLGKDVHNEGALFGPSESKMRLARQ